MRTKTILFSLPVIIAAFFAADLVYLSAVKKERLNELVVSSIGDASFLNPVLFQDTASGDVVSLVFNGLLKYDENLVLKGELAESFTVKEGEKPVIIFRLRKDVRWHDGRPFTSKDVAFTFKTIMDPKTNTVRRSDFELVESLSTPDEHTVVVRYKEPFSPGLSSWTVGIVPAHLLESEDINTTAFNRAPVGTGPFKFVSWKSDESITVAANPDYFLGKPWLDRVVTRIIPETSLAEISLLTDEIDNLGVYPHQYERVKKEKGIRVFNYPTMGYTYIGYNMANPLFEDPRVRRALTHAIDRQRLVKSILYGMGKVPSGPFPPHMWYYDSSVKPLAYDPGEARRLLAEAGWKETDGDGILDRHGKRFSFNLITNNGNDLRKDTGVLVQRQLKEVGVEVKLRLYEWSVFLDRFINPRAFEACILGWSLSVDPDAYNIWHSSQIEKGFNFVAFRNKDADRLLVAGRRVYDHETRKKIYHQFHRVMNREQPYTFLFVAESTPALRDRFIRLLKMSGGRIEPREISIAKAGLMYDLYQWAARSYTGAAITP